MGGRRDREFPAGIDRHDLRLAVLELQPHLAERRGLVAVALGKLQSDDVFTRGQQ